VEQIPVDRLRSVRDELREYVVALHQAHDPLPFSNVQGLTLKIHASSPYSQNSTGEGRPCSCPPNPSPDHTHLEQILADAQALVAQVFA